MESAKDEVIFDVIFGIVVLVVLYFIWSELGTFVSNAGKAISGLWCKAEAAVTAEYDSVSVAAKNAVTIATCPETYQCPSLMNTNTALQTMTNPPSAAVQSEISGTSGF